MDQNCVLSLQSLFGQTPRRFNEWFFTVGTVRNFENLLGGRSLEIAGTNGYSKGGYVHCHLYPEKEIVFILGIPNRLMLQKALDFAKGVEADQVFIVVDHSSANAMNLFKELNDDPRYRFLFQVIQVEFERNEHGRWSGCTLHLTHSSVQFEDGTVKAYYLPENLKEIYELKEVPRDELTFQFWALFKRYLDNERSFLNVRMPKESESMTLLCHKGVYLLYARIYGHGADRVAIIFEFQGMHVARYRYWKSNKNHTEEKLGNPAEFDGDGRTYGVIRTYYKSSKPEDPANWPVQFSWLKEMGERAYKVFREGGYDIHLN